MAETTYRILGGNFDVGVIRIAEESDLVVFPSSPIAAHTYQSISKAVFVSKDAQIAQIDLISGTISRRSALPVVVTRLLVLQNGSLVGLNAQSLLHINKDTLAATRFDVALTQDDGTASLHSYDDVAPPLEAKSKSERASWTDGHRPNQWQWARDIQSWPIYSGSSFAFPYDPMTATLDSQGKVVAIFNMSGNRYDQKNPLLSGVGVVRFDILSRTLTTTIIAGFDGKPRMQNTRQAVALSDDGAGLLIDRMHIRRCVQTTPRRLFGKSKPASIHFQLELEYWDLGDGSRPPIFKGFTPLTQRPLAKMDDLHSKQQPVETELDRLLAEDPDSLQRLFDSQDKAFFTYPSEQSKYRDGIKGRIGGLSLAALAYDWPDGANLPRALMRDGSMRQMAIGVLGPCRPVSGLERYAENIHTKARIEKLSSSRDIVLQMSNTVLSPDILALRIRGETLDTFEANIGPVASEVVMTLAQTTAEHASATRLAKRYRPGRVTIKTINLTDLVGGVALLSQVYAKHHAEIVIGDRWDAALTHRTEILDEISWSRRIASKGNTTAIPVLDNFLRTVMTISQSNRCETASEVPPSPAAGYAYWDVWHPDNNLQLGMATANALIRLSGTVPDRALTFYRHHDFEHDMFTGDEGLRLDVIPHVSITAPGVLNLYAVVGLQLMCTGRVGPDLFAEHGTRKIAAELSNGSLDPDLIAQIFVAEARALSGNLPWASHAGPEGILYAAVDALTAGSPWQARFADALRHCLPKVST